MEATEPPKYCKLCCKNLDEIRNPNFPDIPRNVEKFCSKSHMIEYSKRKNIREIFKADGITWQTFNGARIFRNQGMTLHYSSVCDKCKIPIQITVPSRKSKWANLG